MNFRFLFGHATTAVGPDRQRFIKAVCSAAHIQVYGQRIRRIAKLVEQLSNSIEIRCLNLIFYIPIRRKNLQSVILFPSLQWPNPRVVLLRR